ncbi:hypothetical protein E2C01_002143 [Portunus trituberculatus]|uniref:Secreted protein n=1 Tax=Portunus trituberculatus TaxID=210409 RepID=A0A5B7CJL1_PORTR|nr:hypothetical protein [Portunus trituberculatus]
MVAVVTRLVVLVVVTSAVEGVENMACIAMGAAATHVPELHKIWSLAWGSLTKLMNSNLNTTANGPGGVPKSLTVTDQVNQRCFTNTC